MMQRLILRSLFLLVTLSWGGALSLSAQEPYVEILLNLRDENGNMMPSKDVDSFAVSFQMMDFCHNKSGKVCLIQEMQSGGPWKGYGYRFTVGDQYNWGIFRMEIRHGNEKMEVRYHLDESQMKAHPHLARGKAFPILVVQLEMTWSPGYHEVRKLPLEGRTATYTQGRESSRKILEDGERKLDPVLAYQVKWR